MSTPAVIAHRGMRSEAPENTVPSLRLALELEGLFGLEFDVELSADDRPLVLHQETVIANNAFTALEAATRDFVHRDWVGERSAREILKLDAGSGFKEAFADLRVPELSTVLDLPWKDTVAFMELKDPTCFGTMDPARPLRMLNATSGSLHAFRGDLQLISFNPEMLRLFHNEFSRISTGLLLWMNWQDNKEAAVELARSIGATGIGIADIMIEQAPEWIDIAHAADLLVGSYPVTPTFDEQEYKDWTPENRKTMWDKMVELNVDTITTDFPRELIAHLG